MGETLPRLLLSPDTALCGRGWGAAGESRGSGQARWPCPLVSCPCPVAQAPLPRGPYHLPGRKEQKSEGSSLFRNSTRLSKHSEEGGPEKRIRAHEWRRSEEVPTRTGPSWELLGQGSGCPKAPRERRPCGGSSLEGAPALPAQWVRVCSWKSVCVRRVGACSSRPGRSVHCRGVGGADSDLSQCPWQGGGSSPRGSVLHIHTAGWAGGSRSPPHTALLSQTSQHQSVTTALSKALGG